MKVTLIDGRPAFTTDGGEPVLTGFSCGLNFDALDGFITMTSRTKNGWRLEDGGKTAVSDCATVRFAPEGDGIRFTTVLRNEEGPIEKCHEFVVMQAKLTERIVKFFGAGLREVDGNRTNEMLTSVETMELGEKDQFECGDFAVLVTESGKQYIAGFLSYREYFSGLIVRGDGSLEVRAYVGHVPLDPEQTLTGDVFYFTETKDAVRDLNDYCDRCVREMIGEPRRKFDVPFGFCTWYYYLSNISERTVTESVEDLVKYRDLIPAKYVQIDDGWQKFYGEWDENERFACGMKKCADEIRAAGFIPGLWFAPFWANKARIRQEHPEYFAVDRETGEPTITLDYSVPGACDFIRGVVSRATREWGFRYLKLDLITTRLGAYKYHDPSFNSLKNYRRCMEVINEAVPDDTFILGCTSPFGPSIGLVDGMRVSSDIFGDWDSLKVVFNAVLNRYYYHKRFFINDADCLIVRKVENEDADCRRNCVRTDDEIRCYISGAAASGGVLMLSDKLRLMSEEQLRQISYLYPINEDAALPLDLLDSYIPGVLDCGVRGKIRTVILINWDDENKTFRVPLGDGNHRVFEFWSRSHRGVYGKEYTATLAPHTCFVLHITDDGEPAVAACGNEIVPTLEQSTADGRLTFTFIKPDDTVFVSARSVSGDGVKIEPVSQGLFAVTGSGTVTLAVK